MSNKKAFVVMDFVNEIVHPDGKFKGKGYADFVARHKVLENLRTAISKARSEGYLIVFVKVGFSKSYVEQPKNSVLFGKANDFKALTLDTWATEFHSDIDVQKDDLIITKHRISPYYGTPLDVYLRNNGVEDVYLCGVATDLVVQSAARDSHDRDYNVYVVSDCCGAGSEEDHSSAISTIKKIATVCSVDDM